MRGDVPYENGEAAAAGIPNAELITVDQFGHLLWLGDPQVTEGFQERIVTFLRKHAAEQRFGGW